VDGRVENPGVQHHTFYIEATTTPGTPYVLGFRLDSFASGTTSVNISNIQGEDVH
jgi:hypothetical protein